MLACGADGDRCCDDAGSRASGRGRAREARDSLRAVPRRDDEDLLVAVLLSHIGCATSLTGSKLRSGAFDALSDGEATRNVTSPTVIATAAKSAMAASSALRASLEPAGALRAAFEGTRPRVIGSR